MNNGLALLGWRFDKRLTTDDAAQLWTIAETALELQRQEALADAELESLALDAYEILYHQVVGAHERADMASCTYHNSRHFRKLIPLIDEATICFFRGYYTASLSLLFVVLEAALLSIHGWTPGDKKPRFKELLDATLTLPNAGAAQIANSILNNVYSKYEANTPSQFLFNRHGLLHGLRIETKYDEMNCARALQLIDTICAAEGVLRKALGDNLELHRHRSGIYEHCQTSRTEQMLISIAYPHSDT